MDSQVLLIQFIQHSNIHFPGEARFLIRGTEHTRGRDESQAPSEDEQASSLPCHPPPIYLRDNLSKLVIY